MKQLHEMTKDEAKHICELLGEPYIEHITNDDEKWNDIGLAVQIHTSFALDDTLYDSIIWIYYDGKIFLWKDSEKYKQINTLPIIDYLRSLGYEFRY